MKILRRIDNAAAYKDTKLKRVSLLVVGRGGSSSPRSFIILYKGRKITPYEQKIRKWRLELNSFFNLIYTGSIIQDLIYRDSPLFRKMRKVK